MNNLGDTIRRIFSRKKIFDSQEKTRDHDLEGKSENKYTHREQRNQIIFAIALFLLLFGYFKLQDVDVAHSFIRPSSQIINRETTINFWDKKKLHGQLLFFSRENVMVLTDSNERVHLELSLIKSIEFFNKKEAANLTKEKSDQKKDKAKKPSRQLSDNEKRFLGKFQANVTDHIAYLRIYQHSSGRLGASIQFLDWGNRIEEILYHVRVHNDQIQFKRVCYGKRCQEIGSSKSIKQTYVGIISENGQFITGSYKGGQNGSEWSAFRLNP